MQKENLLKINFMHPVIATMCLLLIVPGLSAQRSQSPRVLTEPLSKEVLIEVMQARGLPRAELVRYVNQNGVSFELSDAIEQELRRAASYLDPADQDAVIAAVRSKYKSEWNPYRRFLTLTTINPKAAYEAGQEYLLKYETKNPDYAANVKAFIKKYNEELTSEPLELAIRFLAAAKAAEEKNDPELAKKKYTDAAQNFTLDLKTNPKSWLAYSGLITAQEKLGQRSAAVVTYDALASQNPSDSEVFRQACAAFLNENHYPEALKACTRAVKLDSGNAQGRKLLGDVYYHAPKLSRDKKAAVDQYKAAVAKEPNNHIYLTALGDAYNILDDHKQARAACKEAQRFKLDYAPAYNCVGEAYKDWDSQGGPGSTAAREAFQMAVALEPGNARFQKNLADSYRVAKQYERAIKAYQEAIKLLPGYKAAHHGLGRTYLDLCMINEAKLEQEKLDLLGSEYAAELHKQIEKKQKKCSSL